MSLILFVQEEQSLRSAMVDANALLVFMRQREPQSPELARVHGIWVGSIMEWDLPGPANATLGLRASFGLTGVWAFAWLESTELRRVPRGTEQTSNIVDELARIGPPSPSARFFTVFDVHELEQNVTGTMRRLRDRHPWLVAPSWLVDDFEHGITMANDLH